MQFLSRMHSRAEFMKFCTVLKFIIFHEAFSVILKSSTVKTTFDQLENVLCNDFLKTRNKNKTNEICLRTIVRRKRTLHLGNLPHWIIKQVREINIHSNRLLRTPLRLHAVLKFVDLQKFPLICSCRSLLFLLYTHTKQEGCAYFGGQLVGLF